MCNEAARIFTSTYDNFIQTAGIRDGASTEPNFSDTSDVTSIDPEVINTIDISNAFNTLCRALALDVLRYFDWEGHVHFAIVLVACKVPAGPGAGRLLILTMGTSKAR